MTTVTRPYHGPSYAARGFTKRAQGCSHGPAFDLLQLTAARHKQPACSPLPRPVRGARLVCSSREEVGRGPTDIKRGKATIDANADGAHGGDSQDHDPLHVAQQPTHADSDPQLVVDVDKRAVIQVDGKGRVDAEREQKVHVDGPALSSEGAEGGVASAISSTVVNAALGALDVVADVEAVGGPIEPRMLELEGKYRMLDDRLDLIDMRLVELGKGGGTGAGVGGPDGDSAGEGGKRGERGKGGEGGTQAAAAGIKESGAKLQSRLTEVVNSGYLESIKQLRENLMLHEWELSNKAWARRRGVSDFEVWCVERDVDIDYDLLAELYADPTSEEVLRKLPPRLRCLARASVERACDERMNDVYARCTETAKQLAMQKVASGVGSKIFSFIKKIVPFKIPFIG